MPNNVSNVKNLKKKSGISGAQFTKKRTHYLEQPIWRKAKIQQFTIKPGKGVFAYPNKVAHYRPYSFLCFFRRRKVIIHRI